MATMSDYIESEVTQEEFDIKLNAFLDLEVNINIKNIYLESGSNFEVLPEPLKVHILQSLRITTVTFYIQLAALPE